MVLLLFPSFFCELICYFISANASVCWYPLKNNTGSLSEDADVLYELFFAVCQVHHTWGLAGLRVSLWGRLLSWASLPTKWWFLWHSAVLGLQHCSLSTASHRVLTERMEICLDAWCKHHILRFLWRVQLSHRCSYVPRMLLDSAC